MTDMPPSKKPEVADRIAKVIARAGLASRREAERMVLEGRVTVNGEKITSPALNVLPHDKITVDGKKLDEPQETRLWLYYKPVGLITSEADEKGRQTVFDALPRDLPRVMSVGRLDLNSEGLLLLTNDGDLKRRLELPETGWLRRYRVRVNGQPNDLTFAPLRRGITLDDESFSPMEIKLDSQQGANAWLTVGIREGKNREIRRAMAYVGLQVNRLIRIGYGPFKLTGMETNEVREIKRRVLRDQLGSLLTGETDQRERPYRERRSEAPHQGGRKPFDRASDHDGRPRKFSSQRTDNESRSANRTSQPFKRSDSGTGFGAPRKTGEDRKEQRERRSFNQTPERSGKPRYGADGERSRDNGRSIGEKRPFVKRGGDSDQKLFGRQDDSKQGGDYKDRKPFRKRSSTGQDEERKGSKPFGKRFDRTNADRSGYSRDDARPGQHSDGSFPKKSYGHGRKKPPYSGPKSEGPKRGEESRFSRSVRDKERKPYSGTAEGGGAAGRHDHHNRPKRPRPPKS